MSQEEFRPTANTFKLLFGEYVEDGLLVGYPDVELMIGWAWLYALHVRSCIARKKLWQAEYMLSGMRDKVLTLACLRHGLPTSEGRGLDQLPLSVTKSLKGGLVRWLDTEELSLAFKVVSKALIAEIGYIDPGLAARLKPVLKALSDGSTIKSARREPRSAR